MKISRESTACFTGYRTVKLLRTSKDPQLIEMISANLEQTLLKLYEQES